MRGLRNDGKRSCHYWKGSRVLAPTSTIRHPVSSWYGGFLNASVSECQCKGWGDVLFSPPPSTQSYLCGTCEGDFINPCVQSNCRPHSGSKSGQNVDHTWRKPRLSREGEGRERAWLRKSWGQQGPVATHVPGAPYLLDEGAQVEGGERGLLGRLEDHGVAAAKGRCNLPRKHQEGEVPLCKQNAFVVS